MSVNEEIRASAAAHRDLGPGYESAVAEGLVERIGEEIDRRVDARLFGSVRQNPPYQEPPPRPRRSGLGIAPVFLALGSMGLGIGATAVVLHPGNGAYGGTGALVALIWLVIGAINVVYARHR